MAIHGTCSGPVLKSQLSEKFWEVNSRKGPKSILLYELYWRLFDKNNFWLILTFGSDTEFRTKAKPAHSFQQPVLLMATFRTTSIRSAIHKHLESVSFFRWMGFWQRLSAHWFSCVLSRLNNYNGITKWAALHSLANIAEKYSHSIYHNFIRRFQFIIFIKTLQQWVKCKK